MVEELIQKEEWEPLQEREDETFVDTIEVKEGDLAIFSPELIHDFEEDVTDEQRQNLYQQILDMSTQEKFRLANLANRLARNLLIHDPNKMISLAVLKNRKINENEVLQYAQKRDLSEDIVLAIAKDQKWKKSYPIKFAVASNPKTPLSVGFNLLPHLRERDLKSLSRDKDVSSTLRRKAQEILLKRNGK